MNEPFTQEEIEGATKDTIEFMKRMAPIHLVPQDVVMIVAWALKDGANKYGEGAWKGDDTSWIKHTKKAQGHVKRWLRGKSIDEDSKVPALAHAIARLMIVLHHEINDMGIDDRNKVGRE